MADVAALSAAVLVKVAEFLRKLPADALEDLVAGEAKLELVPKGGRPAPRSRAATAQSTVDSAEVRRVLGTFSTVADAARYLDGLGLKLPERKALAADLGVTLTGRATLASVRDAIVRAYVGDVLNSDAIRRQAAAS
jgi:hypothetical protein